MCCGSFAVATAVLVVITAVVVPVATAVVLGNAVPSAVVCLRCEAVWNGFGEAKSFDTSCICCANRAIPTLKGIRETKVWEWTRVEILHHFRQLLLDILFLLQLVFVIAFVYR